MPFKMPNQWSQSTDENEKRSEMQTLRTGCSKAEPKIFAPPQTPFLGAQDSQNLISWRRSLPSPTVKIDAHSFELSW